MSTVDKDIFKSDLSSFTNLFENLEDADKLYLLILLIISMIDTVKQQNRITVLF